MVQEEIKVVQAIQEFQETSQEDFQVDQVDQVVQEVEHPMVGILVSQVVRLVDQHQDIRRLVFPRFGFRLLRDLLEHVASPLQSGFYL